MRPLRGTLFPPCRRGRGLRPELAEGLVLRRGVRESGQQPRDESLSAGCLCPL